MNLSLNKLLSKAHDIMTSLQYKIQVNLVGDAPLMFTKEHVIVPGTNVQLPVFVNNMVVYNALNVPPTTAAALFGLDEKLKPVIVMNDSMDKAPNHIREAIIFHEVGHYVQNSNPVGEYKRDIEVEHFCDLYSQNQGKHMIQALRYMLDQNPYNEELKVRIKYLERMKALNTLKVETA